MFQEGGSKVGVLGGYCGFLIIDFEDMVNLDIMDHLGRPQGKYTELFLLIPLLQLCQVGQEGGTWKMIRVLD